MSARPVAAPRVAPDVHEAELLERGGGVAARVQGYYMIDRGGGRRAGGCLEIEGAPAYLAGVARLLA